MDLRQKGCQLPSPSFYNEPGVTDEGVAKLAEMLQFNFTLVSLT